MTSTSDARIRFEDSEVTTPRLRTSARRALFWIVVVLLLVILGVVGLALTGTRTSSTTLSATNPGPTGVEALINVLRDDGVGVKVANNLVAATKAASTAPSTTTVAVYDPNSILSTAQLRSLTTISSNLVLIQPTAHELDVVAPGIDPAGAVGSSAKADCSFTPVIRAGTVSGLREGYRATSSGNAISCLKSYGSYSLVRVHHGAQTVTVFGATTPLTNQSVVIDGNAALALGLFGSTPHLVWYLPTIADVQDVAADGNIPLPPWEILVVALVAVVLLAAALWRGRRLGPVVIERMPVTVRASETLEGRARLYQRASARGHALDALRIGTISRISVLCGLPTLSTVDEVIGATATRTGRGIDSLRQLLLDATPRNDAALVRMSDELRQLEVDVRAAVVPR